MLQPRRSPPVLSNGAGSTLSQAQVFSSFMFVDSSGAEHAVRWSLLPAAQPVPVSPADLAKRGPDLLAQEITERVRGGPLRWTMVVTAANPGDPTADPNKAWPEDRRAVGVGTLIVQQIQAERDGPCLLFVQPSF